MDEQGTAVASFMKKFQTAIIIGSTLLRLIHMALLDSTDSQIYSNGFPVRTLTSIQTLQPEKEIVTFFSSNDEPMAWDKQMKYVLDCYITQFLLTKNQFSKEWISSLHSSLVLCAFQMTWKGGI